MRSRLVAFFAALCLFLVAVEYAIPKPLPFLRLGLTNLPVILSLQNDLVRRRKTCRFCRGAEFGGRAGKQPCATWEQTT